MDVDEIIMFPAASKKVLSIHSGLREQIVSCEWQEGDMLPTELELAERFECSPNTIAKAMALLAQEGLVERKARVGTRVVRNVPLIRGNDKRHRPVARHMEAFAFIYPSDLHEGIWLTVKGFQNAAHKHSRRAVLLPTGNDYQKEAEYISNLPEFQVRGAVIYPMIFTPEHLSAFSRLLLTVDFPSVLASVNLIGLGRPVVTVDAFHAGYTMTRYLIDKGLRRIGFFSNGADSVSMRDRYLGFCRAMEEAALPIADERVFRVSRINPDYTDPTREGMELARGYLLRAKGLQGVVCTNDYLACGLIRAAGESGLRVPKDLLVTGIDDGTLATQCEVPLTTYHVPHETIGVKAFELLEKCAANKEKAFISDVLLRGRLVVRQSA